MPDANDSWYVNSAAKPQDRYEDYIIHGLIAEIDRRYRTISRREARAVAVDSMGGYGAVLFGLKYPNRFRFVGSLGGAIKAAESKGKMFEVFGPLGNATRATYDLFATAAKQPAEELPYFWLACGGLDPNGEENRQLVAFLEQRHVVHNYLESPGGHEWPVSDSQLPAMLNELPHHIELVAQPAATPSGVQQQTPRASFQDRSTPLVKESSLLKTTTSIASATNHPESLKI
jgi:putative tributyrin esterase